jgi:hypothetical protein
MTEWHHDPPPEPGAEGIGCSSCAVLGVERAAWRPLGTGGICFDCYTNLSRRVRDGHRLADCLEQLADGLRRFVVWPSDHFPRVVALWIAHTHFITAFETTPRLAVLSPVKGSGKTRVLELLEASCAGPMFAVNLSPSALFRRLDKGGATLLLDEADTHLGKSSARTSEKYEDLRALVNAGYRAGARVYRSEPTGKTVVEREFDVFAPVAVAGIGDLPDTVLDRSIIVPMRRRSRRERIDRYRIRIGREVFGPLRNMLVELAEIHGDDLAEARPELPDGIEDRAADCWEPLIAIADLAGGQWPQWARVAAVEINRLRAERAPSLGEQLLADCRRVFDTLAADRVTSADLVTELCRLDDAPWADLRGSMLDARGLARRLRPFEVHPNTIRLDKRTLRGYMRESFEDAWERYLPSVAPPQIPQRAQQPQRNNGGDVVDVVDVSVFGGMGEAVLLRGSLSEGLVRPLACGPGT